MTRAIKNNYYNNEQEQELSQEELAFFKNALEEKKLKIQQDLDNTNKESVNNTQSTCKDEADHVSLEILNHVNSAIFREQTIMLNQINRSLNKIVIGTYGICKTCEEPINIERLKVKIFTEYCVPCRELMEREQ